MEYMITYDIDGDNYADTIVGLRAAVREIHDTRTLECEGHEYIYVERSGGRPRWITVVHGVEYRTGLHESRTLHIPPTVRVHSARRIARLCGAAL